MYYKMLKKLSETYQVYAIDLIGMGLSSRPNFICTTTEETVALFTGTIEKWRETLGLHKFVLVGHSFGGYMSCQYTIKYPSHVSKLFLVSPLGFTKDNSEFNMIKAPSNLGFMQRQLHKLRYKFFKNKMTISSIITKYAWLFSYFIRKNLANRYKIPNDHADVLYEYLLHTFKLPDSCQKSLHYVINPNIIAYDPLEDYVGYLDHLNIPVVVFYGDNDWMNDEGAQRVNKLQKENFKLIYIKDSGHNINMENPEELTAHILAC